MRFSKFLLIFAGLFIFSACGFFFAEKQKDVNSSEVAVKPKIVATIFPLADLARQLTGDEFEVISLIPAGANPHTFEPKPSTLISLQGAKILFTVGQGFDAWVEGLVTQTGGIEISPVDQGIFLRKMADEYSVKHSDEHEHQDEKEDNHAHGEFDPHYWLSVKNAKVIALNMKEELSRLYPEKTDFFEENYNKFIADMEVLERQMRLILMPVKGAKIVTFHDAWGYFAEDYGLQIVDVFALSSGKEPGAKHLARLRDLIAKDGVVAVFAEVQSGKHSLKALIEETGVKYGELDDIGGLGKKGTYAKMMLSNAKEIRDVLEKKSN